MAVKQNDWFAINLMNDNVDTLDLMSKGITAENTSMGSRESYKQKQQVQDKFRTESGKFDEDAFNKMYDSCLLTYNSLANNEFEENFLKSVEQHPNYWLDSDAPVLNTNATVSISDDPYHRGMGLSGLTSISDPNWTVREIAQAQEVRDINGNGLGWTPNDHALFSGSLKSLWQPTLAIAAYDEDGYHEDANGNKVRHRKGEYKLHNGEFYYEPLGDRSGVGKEILRVSDTVTVDGTWINKFDLFDADSVDKSVGGTIARTALEIAPMLIPGVNAWLGAAGMVFHTAQAMPEIGKALNGFFGGEKNAWGKSLNRQSNFFKRFASTQSDKGREKFMSFEQVGTQIVDVANQLYQQKFAAQLGGWLSKAFSGKELPNPKVGRAFSTSYMAATSGMDTYDMAKQAGLNDMWAGITTLGVMAGFYTLMSGDYYKETLFGEDSWLNEEFVTKNTLKNIGKEIEAAAKGLPVNPTPVQAKSVFQKFFEKTKSGISKSWKKLKQWTSKEKVGEAVATAEADTAKATTETASTAAKKLTASEVRAKAQKAINFGKFGQGEDSGTSWFNIMLNRASNEGLEEIMEEAMTDTMKAISVGAEKLGFNVSENETSDIDWGFSFEDFLTRYLTAGIGGFVGGSIFAGIDKWEKIWTPNMRDITSKGISNGERIVYLLQQDGNTKNLISKINKLEKEGAFGSQNLSLKGHAVTDVKGDTKWVFDEAAADKSDSQNAQIAKGLRAYVEYIHRNLAAYDFLKNRDDLTGVFLEAKAENEAALEKYKEENEFGYKQLEKQLNKENKDRKKAGLPELTIMDMYERYNYSQLAVRAMAKAGLFEDFYHDYAMLGTEIVGLQYNLDAEKSDYLQNHPNDLDGWNNNPTKKRLEERIKEVEKQRDAILSGERNAEFVDRAIYEAWTPVSDMMVKMGDKNATPLAERSLFDYAMNRYGLDINDPEMTKGEKELLQSDFDAYKALEKKDKVRASFDIFYNISKLLQPEFEEYYNNQTAKSFNKYFSANVNARAVKAQAAQIQEQLKAVNERIQNLGEPTDTSILETWSEKQKSFKDLIKTLGVNYADIIWEDASVPYEGYWNEATGKFHIKDGSDENEIRKTIIHEVVGHYGLRKLFNSDSFKTKFREMLAKRKAGDVTLAINDDFDKDEDVTGKMMDYFFAIANGSVKSKILDLKRSEKYGFAGINDSKSGYTKLRGLFDQAIANWNTTAEEDAGKDYERTKAELKGIYEGFDWTSTTDEDKNKAFQNFQKHAIRVLTEEYLAELAGQKLTKDDLAKPEMSWFKKIINFFKELFGFSADSQSEDFFIDLMRQSAHNLTISTITENAKNGFRYSFRKDKNRSQIEGESYDYYKYNAEEIETLITNANKLLNFENFRDKYLETFAPKVGSVYTPSTRRTAANENLEHRQYLEINSFDKLLEILFFNGKNISDTEAKTNLSDKEIKSLFVAVGYDGCNLQDGIQAIIFNAPAIMTPEQNALVERLKSVKDQINLNIPIYSFDQLNGVAGTEGVETDGIGILQKEDTQLRETYNEANKDWLATNFALFEAYTKDWSDFDKAKLSREILQGKKFFTENRMLCSKAFTAVPGPDGFSMMVTNIEYLSGLPFIDPTTGTVADPRLAQAVYFADDFSEVSDYTSTENPELVYCGEIDTDYGKKKVFVTPELYNIIKDNNIKPARNLENPALEQALEEKRRLEEQLEETQILSYYTHSELNYASKEAIDFSKEISGYAEKVGNPIDVNYGESVKSWLQALVDYTTYCKEENVDDANVGFVLKQLRDLKKGIKERLFADIVTKYKAAKNIDTQTAIDELNNNTGTEDLNTALDQYIDALINDAENTEEEPSTLRQNRLNPFLEIDEIGAPWVENVFNQVEQADWKQYKQITDNLVPEIDYFSKILEKLKVNRLGQTLSLYKYIQLALKGTEPESQIKLQNYAMEASDMKELLDNLQNANDLLTIIAGASARVDKGIAMFDIWNLYDKSENPFFIFNEGEKTLAYLDRDAARLGTKIDFLNELTSGNSERQIKVQKITAKKTQINILNSLFNSRKLFNVDIPELWKEINDELPDLNEDMTDEAYEQLFEQVKKFEKVLYEKLHNDPDFNTSSEEDIINAIKTCLKLKTDEKLTPGVISEDTTELSKSTIAAYLLSIITTNSDDFYTKLSKVFAENTDIKIPFPAQQLCIRIAHAYMNQDGDLFNKLCSEMGADPDMFLKNVFGIFGSAGTGKTTVVANILGKLNPEKKIYFGAAAKSQSDKLKTSVNANDDQLIQVNDLAQQTAPDWKTNVRISDYKVVYNGNVVDTAYDEKLKDGILIVDESTRLDALKWQALSKFAQKNNVKIIALGDLKQTGEESDHTVGTGPSAKTVSSIFTDLVMLRTPVLSESIRPANQAQRNNLLVFGKVMDKAINELIKTNNENDFISILNDNPFTLVFKNVSDKLIGTNVTTNSADFRSKINAVKVKLRDDEQIAIITDNHNYDTLASDKIEILNPKNAQGKEWDYVFVDTQYNFEEPASFKNFYTSVSRSKKGTLFLTTEDQLNKLNKYITFTEDLEGDLPIAASSAQFQAYNEWMSKLLKGITTPETPASSESSTTPESSSTEESSSESPTTESFRKRLRLFVDKVGSVYYTAPNFYVEKLDDQTLMEICEQLATSNVADFGDNHKIGTYNGNTFVRFKISDNAYLQFFRDKNSDGTWSWKPVQLNSLGEVEINPVLAKSKFIQKLTSIFDQTLKLDLKTPKEVTKAEIFDSKQVKPVDAEFAIDDMLMEAAITNLADVSTALDEINDEKAKKYIKETLTKLRRARTNENNVDDNFYVKKLMQGTSSNEIFGNEAFKNAFLVGTSDETKKKAIKIIADLVKIDAVRADNKDHVKNIDASREKYIKATLGKAFAPKTVDAILNAVFNPHKFFVKNTPVTNTKDLYFKVGNMEIFIGVIRNSKYTEGTYMQRGADGKDSKFSLLFARTKISTRGTQRVTVNNLANSNFLNFAKPAIVVADETVNTYYKNLIEESNKHPENDSLSRLINWMKINNGKTMQAYSNVSYLDMSNMEEIYRVIDNGKKGGEREVWGYNDAYGDVMGVQKAVELSQLYTLSVLVYYAQTGDPQFLSLVQEAFPKENGDKIQNQQEAIYLVQDILGSNGGMEAIKTNSLPANKRRKISENKRNFTRAGLLVNLKQSEKIQTAAIRAYANHPDKSKLLGFLMGFMGRAQDVFRPNRNSIGLRVTVYNDSTLNNGENKSNIKGEFKLVLTGKTKWTAFKREGDGWKNVWEKNTALLNSEQFEEALNIMQNNVGQTDKTFDEFINQNVSMQFMQTYLDKSSNVWKDFNLNITDFFVTLLGNEIFGDPEDLFKLMEQEFKKMNIFRSGIYLETRSQGANYTSQNGNPQDSFWKKTTDGDGEVEYSTDIIKVFNPIRGVNLTPYKEESLSEYTVSDFRNEFAGTDVSYVSDAKLENASTKSEFFDKLNQKIKEENKDRLTYIQYNEDGSANVVYNEDVIKAKFGEDAEVVKFSTSQITIKSDSMITIYATSSKLITPVKSFPVDVITGLQEYAKIHLNLHKQINAFIDKLYTNDIKNPKVYDIEFKELMVARNREGVLKDPSQKILTNIFKQWKDKNC